MTTLENLLTRLLELVLPFVVKKSFSTKAATLKKSFQLEHGIRNVIMTRNLTPERYISLFEVLSETESVHWVQWRFFN